MHLPNCLSAKLPSLLLVLAVGLSGCGGDSSSVSGPVAGDNGNGSNDGETFDDEALQALISDHGLSGDPATPRGFSTMNSFPGDDPEAKLGQLLFFSQSLAGGFDASCGTCHHPDFGGSDGLSISVGVVPKERSVVGPGRRVDVERDQDPRADGGPNMHRNSQTIFNAALHDRALMFDGRVDVLDSELSHGGIGQSIRTPETANAPDTSGADGLIETVSPFPMVNDNEMRGYVFSDLASHPSYRERLMERLRGAADEEHMNPADPPNDWLSRFRDAFDAPEAEPEEVITILNVQRALGSYMKFMVFVDTPWREYIEEDPAAISTRAKEGAVLFLAPEEEGGLGCVSCHSGDRFTDENFHNVGFPQLGRGFRSAEGDDTGRWLTTKAEKDWYSFRTPGLLNVAERGPWGHSGSFETLEALLHYHADPRNEVDQFFSGDFLAGLPQFDDLDVEYPEAEAFTRGAIAKESFDLAEEHLPQRTLSSDEIDSLVAFLESLTDHCVAQASCISQWAPQRSEDPDGHLLVRGDEPGDVTVDEEGTDRTPDPVNLQFSATWDNFADTDASCENDNGLAMASNDQTSTFVARNFDVAARRDQGELVWISGFGLDAPHGFHYDTWFVGDTAFNTEPVMLAGGISAGYFDDQSACWPDLVYAGGNQSGLRLYRNRMDQSGFEPVVDAFPADLGTDHTGVAFADINGNYRRELFVGNIAQGDIFDEEVAILGMSADGNYQRIGGLPTSRHTYGISFGDIDGDGYPELYMAHWAGFGTAGSAPALWKNLDGGETLAPWDEQAGTSEAYISQRFNLTPLFADMTGDGRQDLLLTSDFGTTQALQNTDDGGGGAWFQDRTDSEVITDENGMGAVVADFFNEGRLDWFVTAILDPSGEAAANWGVTGNRLYKNASEEGELAFEDITHLVGEDLVDGNWGWGACAADFNNNGFLDIFMVNGFGYIPEDMEPDGPHETIKERYDEITIPEFQETTPRLFINDGEESFEDRTIEWGLDVPSEGRGVACFDYDRDGDIDIVLLDHSRGLQFFENQTGHGSGSRFLNIRLVGEPPNTDALGARVHVTTDVGNGHGEQQMMRVSQANNSFNAQNPPDLHFGLGEAETADISIVWPDGETTLECSGVDPNQFLIFDQREGGGGKGVCPE